MPEKAAAANARRPGLLGGPGSDEVVGEWFKVEDEVAAWPSLEPVGREMRGDGDSDGSEEAAWVLLSWDWHWLLSLAAALVLVVVVLLAGVLLWRELCAAAAIYDAARRSVTRVWTCGSADGSVLCETGPVSRSKCQGGTTKRKTTQISTCTTGKAVKAGQVQSTWHSVLEALTTVDDRDELR